MSNRAAQFRDAIEEHILPGRGMAVVLRKPDLSALILEHGGEVPGGLTQQLMGELKGRPNWKGWQPEEDDMPGINRLIDLICRAALVSPRVVDDPDYDHDEIEIRDLVTDERMYIFKFGFPNERAQQVAAAAHFRQGQVASVGAVANGEGVQHEAVEPAGAD